MPNEFFVKFRGAIKRTRLDKTNKKLYVGLGLAEDARLRAKTNVCLGTSASIQVICFYFLLSTSLMQ